jgi:sterol desaturase/sphingolipid hydroxylase (fatty acid hydroxylase superfamily)
VHAEFYTTVAQVLPVLLLALVWDSRYLERLRDELRPARRVDPAAGTFWTKPRVRAYVIVIASLILAELCAALLVLAGAAGDSAVLRAGMLAGLAPVLATVGFRIAVDVLNATRPAPPPPPGP